MKRYLYLKIGQHLKCGSHSRIPWCCIFWFVTFWDLFRLKEKWNLWYLKLTNTPSDGNPFGWEYIPCPLCLIMKRNVGRPLKCKCEEEYVYK
jgi:hypothetical protein